MRNRFFITTGLCIMIFLKLFAQDTPSRIERIMEDHELVGMSVIAVFEDEIVFSGYYGMANISGNVPVTPLTMYRVASVSKTFTAVAILQLQEQGLLDLDADVSDILGYNVRNPRFPDVPITVRMLLTHTASLNDGSSYSNFLSLTYGSKSPPSIHKLISPDAQHFSADNWLNKKPGSYFQYCNMGYGVLGSIIEKLSQLRFDVYVSKNILLPLSLNGSFNVYDITEMENLAVLYRKADGEWMPQVDYFPDGLTEAPDYSDYEPGHNGLIFGPQGGLRISAADLSKFMRMLMNGGHFNGVRILSEQSVKQMQQLQWQYDGTNGDNYHNLFNAWGLGMHLITEKDQGDRVVPGYQMAGHSGLAYGLVSAMYFHSNSDFGLIFITNGSGKSFEQGIHSAFFKMEEEVFDVLFNEVIKPYISPTDVRYKR